MASHRHAINKEHYIQVTTSDKTENDYNSINADTKTQIELTNINSAPSLQALHSGRSGVVNTKEDTSLIEHSSISDIPIEKDISLSQPVQTKHNKALKGNLFLCCYDKHGTPHICIGPHCM